MKIKQFLISLICTIAVCTAAIPTPTASSDADIEALEARITELENRCAYYEDRMAKLSAAANGISYMSDNIVRCDINGDRTIDAVDASLILQAYALLSTGVEITKISQVIHYDIR